MTSLRIICFVIAASLLAAGEAGAQQLSQCIGVIQQRLDDLGDAGKQKFNLSILRDDIKDFDIGSISAVVNDANKKTAFKRIYTSMSEFVDAAGDKLSAEGMRGYGRYGPCIIKADGSDTIDHLREAFTRSGAFKGKDFDDVMKQLADDGKFSLDPATRTFTSQSSGLKFGPETYKQGEKHSINHLFRGHTANEFTDAATNPKSIFSSADEVFDLIDQAWNSPSKTPYPNSTTGWIVDLAPKTVGVDQAGQATTKLAIFVNPGDVFRTAFPY